MIHISALNESSNDDRSTSRYIYDRATKEAQESEAFALYKEALSLQREGKHDDAEDTFKTILNTPFVDEAKDLYSSDDEDGCMPVLSPAHQLKYSTLKNLASISAKHGDYKIALKHYVDAVNVDSTDVTIWYKLGLVALKLKNFPLAKHAFTQGLECSVNHWPCLDKAITVLYVLYNYEACLAYIARALAKDADYMKGIALRDQIYSEQPSLEEEAKPLFEACDSSVFANHLTADEAEEFITEARDMRVERKDFYKPVERPLVSFSTPFYYTWKCLGECLITTYDKIVATEQTKVTLASSVDLSAYRELPTKRKKRVRLKKVNVNPSQPLSVDGANNEVKIDNKLEDRCLEDESESDKTDDKIAEEITHDMETGEKEPCSDDSLVESDRQKEMCPSLPDSQKEISVSLPDSQKEIVSFSDSQKEFSGSVPDSQKEMSVFASDSQNEFPVSLPGSQKEISTSVSDSQMEIFDSVPDTQNEVSLSVSDSQKETSTFVSDSQRNVSVSKPDSVEEVDKSNPQKGINNDGSLNISKHIASRGALDTIESREENNESSRHSDNSSGSNERVHSHKNYLNNEVSSTTTPIDLDDNDVLIDDSNELINDSGESVGGGITNSSVCEVVSSSLKSEKDVEQDIVVECDVKEEVSVGCCSPHTSNQTDHVPCEMKMDISNSTSNDKEQVPNVSRNISEKNKIDVMDEMLEVKSDARELIQKSIAIDDSSTSEKMNVVKVEKDSQKSLPNKPVIDTTEAVSEKTNVSGGDCIMEVDEDIDDSSSTDPDYVVGAQEFEPIEAIENALTFVVCATAQASPVLSKSPKTPKSPVTETCVVEEDTEKVEEIKDDEISKKSHKRRRVIDDESLVKRRSSRVRNPGGRKKQEKELEQVNYQEVLTQLLPSNLISILDSEVEMTTDDSCNEMSQSMPPPSTTIDNVDSKVYAGPIFGDLSDVTQMTDVHQFMLDHQHNGGVIPLLMAYLTKLAHKATEKWCEGLCDLYVQAFSRLREHIMFPDYLCRDIEDSEICNIAMIALVLSEIKVDRWMTAKSRSIVTSPLKGSVLTASRIYGADYPGAHYLDDLTYLCGISTCNDVFGDLWLIFASRVWWMRAHFLTTENKIDEAVSSLEEATTYLEWSYTINETPLKIALPNQKQNDCINIDEVANQIALLQRSQSLEEVQCLYDDGKYSEVIELMIQTFNQPVDRARSIDCDSISQERHSQLLLLQEALIKQKDYKKCLLWSEASINEAFKTYNCVTTESNKQQWCSTLVMLLAAVNRILKLSDVTLLSLHTRTQARLCSNMIKIIDFTMDELNEDTSNMPIQTQVPWILLYKVIKSAECSLQEDFDEEEDMVPSLMLLNTAHEHLARRGWCCSCEGELLLFMIEELVANLHLVSDVSLSYDQRTDIEHALEQSIYCLYSHPNKRGKAKHLDEHNTTQLPLTWEYAQIIYKYYKPINIPAYDGYKTTAISNELENLFKHIQDIAPDTIKSEIPVKQVELYIQGENEELSKTTKDFSESILLDLYYLLADYYFKNKERDKAIQFYMLDITVNVDRFDSWAGMALARAANLETKLNCYELKIDAEAEELLQKKSAVTLRCFKHALHINNSSCTLWIEYGSVAYQLHSHESRTLKQNAIFLLPSSVLVKTRELRNKFLCTAEECYTNANEIANKNTEEEQEQWLHHYMLGKIAEKMKKSPEVYLQHYRKAADYLHEDHANYPRKITYIYNPPRLALETLEIYYRMHNSILKCVMKKGNKFPFQYFNHYLKVATKLPFALCQQKRYAQQEYLESQKQKASKDKISALEYEKVAATKSAAVMETFSIDKNSSQDSQKPIEMQENAEKMQSADEKETSEQSEKNENSTICRDDKLSVDLVIPESSTDEAKMDTSDVSEMKSSDVKVVADVEKKVDKSEKSTSDVEITYEKEQKITTDGVTVARPPSVESMQVDTDNSIVPHGVVCSDASRMESSDEFLSASSSVMSPPLITTPILGQPSAQNDVFCTSNNESNSQLSDTAPPALEQVEIPMADAHMELDSNVMHPPKCGLMRMLSTPSKLPSQDQCSNDSASDLAASTKPFSCPGSPHSLQAIDRSENSNSNLTNQELEMPELELMTPSFDKSKPPMEITQTPEHAMSSPGVSRDNLEKDGQKPELLVSCDADMEVDSDVIGPLSSLEGSSQDSMPSHAQLDDLKRQLDALNPQKIEYDKFLEPSTTNIDDSSLEGIQSNETSKDVHDAVATGTTCDQELSGDKRISPSAAEDEAELSQDSSDEDVTTSLARTLSALRELSPVSKSPVTPPSRITPPPTHSPLARSTPPPIRSSPPPYLHAPAPNYINQGDNINSTSDDEDCHPNELPDELLDEVNFQTDASSIDVLFKTIPPAADNLPNSSTSLLPSASTINQKLSPHQEVHQEVHQEGHPSLTEGTQDDEPSDCANVKIPSSLTFTAIMAKMAMEPSESDIAARNVQMTADEPSEAEHTEMLASDTKSPESSIHTPEHANIDTPNLESLTGAFGASESMEVEPDVIKNISEMETDGTARNQPSSMVMDQQIGNLGMCKDVPSYESKSMTEPEMLEEHESSDNSAKESGETDHTGPSESPVTTPPDVQHLNIEEAGTSEPEDGNKDVDVLLSENRVTNVKEVALLPAEQTPIEQEVAPASEHQVTSNQASIIEKNKTVQENTENKSTHIQEDEPMLDSKTTKSEEIALVPEVKSTNTEEVLPSQEVVPTQEVVLTEEVVPTIEVVPTEEVVPAKEVVPTQKVVPAQEVVQTKEVVPIQGVVPTEEIVPNQEVVPTEEVMTTKEVVPVDQEMVVECIDVECTDKQVQQIVEQCIVGLQLCLSRFPHHYKSLYRLANVYHHHQPMKNESYCRDLLLGSVSWQQLSHMPSPGLFQERKQNNFFQGLWRYPIQEIERSGSFSAHLTRSLVLLMHMLLRKDEVNLLLYLYVQLNKTPDPGRKYVRDSERVYLANKSLDTAILCAEIRTEGQDSTGHYDDRLTNVMTVYRVYHYCTKMASTTDPKQVARAKAALSKIYATAMNIKETGERLQEMVIRFCSQQAMLKPSFMQVSLVTTSIQCNSPSRAHANITQGKSGSKQASGQASGRSHPLSSTLRPTQSTQSKQMQQTASSNQPSKQLTAKPKPQMKAATSPNKTIMDYRKLSVSDLGTWMMAHHRHISDVNPVVLAHYIRKSASNTMKDKEQIQIWNALCGFGYNQQQLMYMAMMMKNDRLSVQKAGDIIGRQMKEHYLRLQKSPKTKPVQKVASSTGQSGSIRAKLSPKTTPGMKHGASSQASGPKSVHPYVAQRQENDKILLERVVKQAEQMQKQRQMANAVVDLTEAPSPQKRAITEQKGHTEPLKILSKKSNPEMASTGKAAKVQLSQRTQEEREKLAQMQYRKLVSQSKIKPLAQSKVMKQAAPGMSQSKAVPVMSQSKVVRGMSQIKAVRGMSQAKTVKSGYTVKPIPSPNIRKRSEDETSFSVIDTFSDSVEVINLSTSGSIITATPQNYEPPSVPPPVPPPAVESSDDDCIIISD